MHEMYMTIFFTIKRKFRVNVKPTQTFSLHYVSSPMLDSQLVCGCGLLRSPMMRRNSYPVFLSFEWFSNYD